MQNLTTTYAHMVRQRKLHYLLYTAQRKYLNKGKLKLSARRMAINLSLSDQPDLGERFCTAHSNSRSTFFPYYPCSPRMKGK